jgi:serine/threonine protein kinase
LIHQEIAVLKKLDHPLTVHFVRSFPESIGRKLSIMPEFIENGILANHLPGCQNTAAMLRGINRITKIVVAIAIAMRYVHSKGIIHRALAPDNILLDWNWKIRISNFGHSIFADEPAIPLDPHAEKRWPSGNPFYLAPERFEDVSVPESDVFSFGLILYELIVGHRAFPKSLSAQAVGRILVVGEWEPDIPEFVLAWTKDLLCDCLAMDYYDRPSFSEILFRLKEMRFKLMRGVSSLKIANFVKITESDEKLRWM